MVGDYKSVIEPVKNKKTFEEVSDRLKELIFNGTLKAGQHTAILAVFSDLKSRAVSISREQSKDIIDAHEAIVDAIAAEN